MRLGVLVRLGVFACAAVMVSVPHLGEVEPVYWECLPFLSRSAVCNRQTSTCKVLGSPCTVCDWDPIDGQVKSCRKVENEEAECEGGGFYDCYTCGPVYTGTCITGASGLTCYTTTSSSTCSACDSCLH